MPADSEQVAASAITGNDEYRFERVTMALVLAIEGGASSNNSRFKESPATASMRLLIQLLFFFMTCAGG